VKFENELLIFKLGVKLLYQVIFLTNIINEEYNVFVKGFFVIRTFLSKS
jgi:hypothetical protein